MNLAHLGSPTALLAEQLGQLPHPDVLAAYEAWWRESGAAISDAVDRAGTPTLRMFDRFGARRDEIVFSPEYWTMLRRGYRDGVVWRAFAERSFSASLALGYVAAFHDPGLVCPYTVSLGTALPVVKYAEDAVRERFLPRLLARDDTVWQGATWMTEAGGGSDLGAAVRTVARRDGAAWRLTGDKYFASNAGAELAVVAARPEGAPAGVRGVALFLVPRARPGGELNYFVRRMKPKIGTRSVPTGEVELRDAEAHLLGRAEHGIYLVLEVLNLSRVANSIGSTALLHRALAEAASFAAGRQAFGKPLAEQPLMRRQLEDRLETLRAAGALAWESARLLDACWEERPPYSERYHLFRLVTHLAKYWTAEQAVQAAKWCMEVHGGAGSVTDYPPERLLREAMILAIWEGPAHRQILDGLEVMERKGAHRALLEHLAPRADAAALAALRERLEAHLALPSERREVEAEPVFAALAELTARTLARR